MSALKKIDNKKIPTDLSEIRLFAVVQNESLRLPYLIDFYKKMGVGRFFIIDNKSTDKTQDILLSMDNVHVFYTEEKFNNKVRWKRTLLNQYGQDHWCLIVDADELFIYPDYENKLLQDLCNFMEIEGSNVLRSFLLDMYSLSKLSDAVIKKGDNPIDIINHFDADIMKLSMSHDFSQGWARKYRSDGAPAIHGGMRKRTIGHSALLNKVCLFKYDKSMNFMLGHHMLRGPNIRSSSIRSVVLHTKYSADFIEVVEREATRGIYWNNGQEYKMFRSAGVASNPTFSFKGDCSLKFEGSEQLIKLGFMKDNPLFHYKGLSDLPDYNKNQNLLKTSILRNTEKVKILADTVKLNNFQNILDTSFNGGYNSCIILNNCEGVSVHAVGSDNDINQLAKQSLKKTFKNLYCQLYQNNISGIIEFKEKIDFCFLDGIFEYKDIVDSLNHLISLLNKDGMILINNVQLPTVKDAISNINWDGLEEINFRANSEFPLIGIIKKENIEYSPPPQNQNTSKYICIGLSESGFSSVRKVFNNLNFKTETLLYPNKMHRLETTDYIDDLPMCNIFKEIDEKYDTKFIYTKMDLNLWLDKCREHWKTHPVSNMPKEIIKYRQDTYGTECFNEKKFKKVYIGHDKAIKDHFKDKPEQLLTIDLSKHDIKTLTKTIISFIGVENLPGEDLTKKTK